MAFEKHIDILKQGVDTWNNWRKTNPETRPDLRGAGLQGSKLDRINFRSTSLSGADLSDALLIEANLSRSNMIGTDFTNANLTEANLSYSDITYANLTHADLTRADLRYSDISDANLTATKFFKARAGWTTFGNNDLSTTNLLETMIHDGPSTIGIDTIYLSQGGIPETFLTGAGVPDDFIVYLPSLGKRAFEFYSCFISYSHKDEDFAKQLYSWLRNAHVRVWFAPEDIKGGEKLHDQIEHAIQIHDRLLLVLSESSLQSEWVMTEIRKAQRVELKERRRKLFPIRLIDMKRIREWECFDADAGKDLAVEVREYFISDFSKWKNRDEFERASDRLLRDLKAHEPPDF